jgi:hypothetical protein
MGTALSIEVAEQAGHVHVASMQFVAEGDGLLRGITLVVEGA